MQEKDLQILNDLTAKLYNCICFEIDEQPPVNDLNDLFIPTARMIRNNDDTPEIMSVSEFIDSYQERIADGTIKSFYEGELKHITEIFGKIAHRFSTYEAKFDLTEDEPFAIGINSIQFINIDDKWKISSIIWNNQTDDLIIPDRYI